MSPRATTGLKPRQQRVLGEVLLRWSSTAMVYDVCPGLPEWRDTLLVARALEQAGYLVVRQRGSLHWWECVPSGRALEKFVACDRCIRAVLLDSYERHRRRCGKVHASL